MSAHIGENIKAVLFDYDDTLVGTVGRKFAQYKHVAKKYYNKDLTEDEVKQHWGKPLGELLRLLYGTDDVEQAIAINTAHDKYFPTELFVASISTLKRVKSAGKLIGIITATSRFNIERDLATHQIPHSLLDYTQTADDTTFHKPDPRVFEPAIVWLASQEVLPNEVIYIGDGLHDMKAALGAGFNFLGVETGLVTAEQFAGNGATSIPKIADLTISSNTVKL